MEEESGTRKSTRVRQKRTFGDDFVDPENVKPSKYTARLPKKKSNSRSPDPSQMPMKESSSNGDVPSDYVEEMEESVEKYPTEPFEAPSASHSSSILMHIADTVSDGILKEVKEEEIDKAKEQEVAEVKQELEATYSSPAPARQWNQNGLPLNISTRKRVKPVVVVPKIEEDMERLDDDETNYSSLAPARQWNQNGLPLNISTRKRVEPVVVASEDEEDIERLDDDGIREKKLEAATAKKLAAIRAATVQKIIAKRTNGRSRSGVQTAAQDAEINNYITATKDVSVLNQLSSTNNSRGPKFVQLNNRTVVVPPLPRQEPNTAQARAVKHFPLSAPIPLRNSKLDSKVSVGQFLKHQMADSARQNQIPPMRAPAGMYTAPLPAVRRLPIPTSGLPVKVLTREEVGTASSGPSTSDDPRNIHRGPAPSQGKQVAKILISRGPNGEIIPKGRVMIRTAARAAQLVAQARGLVLPPHQLRTPQLKRPAFTQPGSLMDIQPNQPDFIDVKQENMEDQHYQQVKEEVLDEVKQEPIDEVKQEPMDDYEPPMKEPKVEPGEVPMERKEAPQMNVHPKNLVAKVPIRVFHRPFKLSSAWFPKPPTPPPGPRYMPKVVMPKGAQRNASLYDLVIQGNRPPSPHRIFLGAEEPMKDIVPEEAQYGRYTIRKVKSLNMDKFKWKRPVEAYNQPIKKKKELPLKNFVRTGELVGGDEDDDEPEEPEKEPITEEELELRKKKEEEFFRQKRALAQKMMMNETQVWEYMQSEEFKKSIEPDEHASEFQKVLNSPNPLAKVPEFSDSLRATNPVLFQNLLRVFRMKHDQKNKPKNVKADDYIEMMNKRAANFAQARKFDEWEKEKKIARETLKLKMALSIANGPDQIEVIWNGVKTEVPEFVSCHLCGELMRLCMRRAKYMDELRNYPAYRCLRKGCQTFRSVKKEFNASILAGKPYYRIQDPIYSKPNLIVDEETKPTLLDRCEETLTDAPVKLEPVDDDDEFDDMPPLEGDEEPEQLEKQVPKSNLDKLAQDFECGTSTADIVREEEDHEEDEETVDFEYITKNPIFEEEEDEDEEEEVPSEEGALSEYDEDEVVDDEDYMEEPESSDEEEME